MNTASRTAKDLFDQFMALEAPAKLGATAALALDALEKRDAQRVRVAAKMAEIAARELRGLALLIGEP